VVPELKWFALSLDQGVNNLYIFVIEKERLREAPQNRQE
jgi:hypothetical protein